MKWLYLILTIVFEIISTTLLKAYNGFTKIVPTIGTFFGYILCSTFLSIALKKIDISVAYAIWSAAGIVILTIIGIFIFNENINTLKVVSIALIVIGVVGLNLSGVSH